MYIFFLVLWVILNGKLTVEIAVLGFLISGAIYAFMCKFMDFSIGKDIFIIRKSGLILQYVVVLVLEIVKANISVFKMLFSSRYNLEPAIIHFRTNLKSKMARVILANSITLTPGTITVYLDEDYYVVHCLDKDLGKGIDASVFVTLLEKLEAPLGKKREQEG